MRAWGLNTDHSHVHVHSPEELEDLYRQSARGGLIDASEREMVSGVLGVEERVAREIMTPRVRLVSVPASLDVREALARLAQTPYTRFPVTGERVAASFPAEDLMTLFRHGRGHAALVVNEFGGTLGFVTMDDLIEDVMDSGPETGDQWILVNPDGSFSLNGGMTLSDLRGDHGLTLHSDEATTVAGLLLNAHGTVPPSGTVIQIQGYELTAEATEGLKVTRIHLRCLEA